MTDALDRWSLQDTRPRHPWGGLAARTFALVAAALAVLVLGSIGGCLVYLKTHPSVGSIDLGPLLEPTDLVLGQTGSYTGALPGAPRSVTAYFVSDPVPSSTAVQTAGATGYAVVEVAVCAGGEPYTPTDTQSDWSVDTNRGQAPPVSSVGAIAPNIGTTSPGLSVPSDTCGRGSIVFALPAGSSVTSVHFADATDLALPFYRWRVPEL